MVQERLILSESRVVSSKALCETRISFHQQTETCSDTNVPVSGVQTPFATFFFFIKPESGPISISASLASKLTVASTYLEARLSGWRLPWCSKMKRVSN